MDYLQIIRRVPGVKKLEQSFLLSDFVRELAAKNINRKKEVFLKDWDKTKKWDTAI